MLPPEIVTYLEKWAAKWPEGFAGPASPDAIEAAERELGRSFPDSYREFLLRWGGGYVGSLPVYGVRAFSGLNPDYTVMGVTRHYQNENWPDIEGWIIVSEDGRGNPIGIAPDGRVLSVDHDCGFETFVEAEDFVAFLQRQVVNRLPEEPDWKAILQPLTEKKPWWRFWK